MLAFNSVVLALVSAACLCAADEGDALLVELAQEVLDNAELILPNPWNVVANTPSDRDVGTVTEHEWAPAYALEVAPCSLETAAESSGGAPTIAIRRILQSESKNSTGPPPAYRMGLSAGGAAVRRLNGMENPSAATTVWGWQKHKYQVLKEWMDTQIATVGSQSLMALTASGEMLFAGCDEATIQSKYNQILAAVGNTQTIVMAAEVSPFHDDLGYSYATTTGIDNARSTFFANTGLDDTWATTRTTTPCTNGVCNSPPLYQFANSAFIMGPVGDVAEMLSEMSTWDDSLERLVSQYFLKNPDKVALDYAGYLVMSLHNMKLDTNIPVEVQLVDGKKIIHNKVTNDKVCFVHGGGNSFSQLKTLAQELLV
ncbi:unnamed protein product [Prorocentrum cordatum]|uniref:Phospholipase B-like n=1 Tax=Prorocentrum cordatum TaxID=2364126 RepID=A0ABN9VUK2_9DINO|nr:unnamed protein product [Polarella glacialis]